MVHAGETSAMYKYIMARLWVGRPWPLNVEPLLWSGKDPLETCTEWECYFGTSGGWGA